MLINIINRNKLELSPIKISNEKCYVKDIFVSNELKLVAGFFDFDNEYSENFTFTEFSYVLEGKISVKEEGEKEKIAQRGDVIICPIGSKVKFTAVDGLAKTFFVAHPVKLDKPRG